ncbi:MAG: NDP-sugar synthase [Candidatus Woesebacteria bacterium]
MANRPTVVILAGGENSRFFPLNQTTHKAALTLLGKSLVVRMLENLERVGFTDIVIVVSPKDWEGKGLSGFLDEHPFSKLSVQYVLQPVALGMGDALLRAKDKIKDSFAVIYPYLLNAGEQLETLIEQAGNGGALEVAYTKEPWLYGIVTLEGKRIVGIVEKPVQGEEKSNLKQHGMHYLSHAFLQFLENTPEGEYSFEAALDSYFREFEVTAIEEMKVLPSLKYPWHLFEFQKALFLEMPAYLSPYAKVAKTAVLDDTKGSIYIENGATIGHAVKIVGPAYIGKDVFIGDFSLIRASSFEEGSSVGVHSDVTRSIIMEHSSMHNGFMGDTIVGRNVKIGANFITSNRRMDRESIVIKIKEKQINTGSTYMGTVIGDDTKIGIRVNVMPGKFIGCRSIVYPSVTVWDHIPHDCTVKLQMEIQVEQNGK